MSGVPDPLYVEARRVLLDAAEALAAHFDSIVLVGAQAIYLHTGTADFAVAEFTTDVTNLLARSRVGTQSQLVAFKLTLARRKAEMTHQEAADAISRHMDADWTQATVATVESSVTGARIVSSYRRSCWRFTLRSTSELAGSSCLRRAMGPQRWRRRSTRVLSVGTGCSVV